MNTIKNIHLISGILPEENIDDLQQGAFLYKRHANITFKIISVDTARVDSNNADIPKELIVEVRQGRNSTAEYLSVEDLVERAKSLFSRFFPDHDIHARPRPYSRPPTEDVTPEWIQDRMNENKVSLKRLEKDTGLDKTNLSAWVNGKRPMSQPVKAMFYYYFRSA